MYSITRKINFEMAHRIHNQELDPELSLSSTCKCKRIHGHSYEVELTLESKETTSGMVTDLGNLKKFETLLKDTFDHRILLYQKDPLLRDFFGNANYLEICNLYLPNVAFLSNALRSPHWLNCTNDLVESVVIFNREPTSENLAFCIFCMFPHTHSAFTEVSLKAVKVKESPNGFAIYTDSI